MGRYDKIIKESLSKMLNPLAKRIGLNLDKAEIIKDKIQQTIEREPDYLAKVLHENSNLDYIACIEFQSENDKEMPFRTLFNSILLERIHHLPVRVIVFYFGNNPLMMHNQINRDYLYYKYEIYDMRTFNAETFLQSSIPEEVLLALFANFEEKEAADIIEKIVLKLKLLVKSKLKFKKYIFQLRVLSGLRKLQSIVNKKLEAMPIITDFDVTKDLFYQKGIEKGIEKGQVRLKIHLVEKFLLNNKEMAVSTIAELVEVSEDFVKDIQKRLIVEGKLKRNKK